MADAVPSAAVKGTPQMITLDSDEFSDGEVIPQRFTCDGTNTSPPLKWRGVPDGTAELVVVLEDPDDAEETFVHWMVAALDPNLTELPEGWLPEQAVVGTNDFERADHRGPCPPHGQDTHRYTYTLIAARQPLGLDDGFTAEQLRNRLQGQVLGWGELIGRYGRTSLSGPNTPVHSG